MPSATSTKTQYRPDIDGLRAVAVLAVLLFHAEMGVSGGFVGVDVFFVISGFLITRLIISEFDRGEFTFKNFWVRRLRRIWPAASVMAISTLAIGFVILGPVAYHQLATDSIPQALMLANVQFMRATDYFGIAADRRPLLHTWSLAVEEQFYVFYPFLLVLTLKFNRRYVGPALLALASGSFALSFYMLNLWPGATFYLLPTRAWELLVGAILCVAPSLESRSRVVVLVLSTLGVMLIITPMVLYDRSTVFPGIAAIPPCLGAALIILTGVSTHSPYRKMLAFEPIRRIGLMSYSLYLVHWPVLAFMREFNWPNRLLLSWRIVAISISFVLAYLSWRFIEQRFRHPLTPISFMRTVSVSAGASVLVVLIGVLIRETDGASSRFGPSLLAHIAPESIPSKWDTKATDPNNVDPAFVKQIGDDRSHLTPCFLLWGDSHASAISQAVDDEAKRLHLRGFARIVGGVSPVPGLWSTWVSPSYADANDKTLKWILNSEIKHVILAARWSVLTDGANTGPMSERFGSLVSPLGRDKAASCDEAETFLESGLSLLIRALEDSGITVWIIAEIPLQRDSPQQRGIKCWLTGRSLPLRGVSLSEHEDHIRRSMKAIRNAASSRTRIVDLSVPFFDENDLSITAAPDGTSYYSDDDHVNKIGAKMLLTPLLHELFTVIASNLENAD